MNEAAQKLVGKHNFSAFMSAGSTIVDTVRTIYRFEVEQQGEMVLCRVEADGYLYNMVRILCGTLVEIGSGKRDISQIDKALQSGSRQDAGITLPPQGLFLSRVFYDTEREGN